MASGWDELVEQLRGAKYQFGVIDDNSPVHRVGFEPGLTDAEVVSVEARYHFRFPPDLRAFLQTALPCGPLFPNWRSGDKTELREWLDAPQRGVLFDVEHGFWLEEWGRRPASIEDARQVAGDLVMAAPKLIPIHGHRMIPDEPDLPGNPVFSVHQTDIIYYGFDLTDYLRHEFDLPSREPWPEKIRSIRFWDVKRFQNGCW